MKDVSDTGKIEKPEIYQPVTELTGFAWMPMKVFSDLPDSIRKEVAEAVAAIEFNRYPDLQLRSSVRSLAHFIR